MGEQWAAWVVGLEVAVAAMGCLGGGWMRGMLCCLNVVDHLPGC